MGGDSGRLLRHQDSSIQVEFEFDRISSVRESVDAEATLSDLGLASAASSATSSRIIMSPLPPLNARKVCTDLGGCTGAQSLLHTG